MEPETMAGRSPKWDWYENHGITIMTPLRLGPFRVAAGAFRGPSLAYHRHSPHQHPTQKPPRLAPMQAKTLPLISHPKSQKMPSQESGIKESVYKEYQCMELARAIGLQVPASFVLKGCHPLFVIERYDRSHDQQGQTRRIHQQDFCQAQGFTSQQKYEDQGGPTIQQNYELILRHFPRKNRLTSLTNFLDWIAFNLLIGNHDCHSKKISMLLQPEGLTLAPFYDLLCTAIYPKLQREFPFSMGGQRNFAKISAQNTNVLEKNLGLKDGAFKRRLVMLVAKIEKERTPVAERIQKIHSDAKIPARINTLIWDRIKSLRLHGLK